MANQKLPTSTPPFPLFPTDSRIDEETFAIATTNVEGYAMAGSNCQEDSGGHGVPVFISRGTPTASPVRRPTLPREDFPIDDRRLDCYAFEFIGRDRQRIVRQDNQICKFALFDRALDLFFKTGIGAEHGVDTNRFRYRDCFLWRKVFSRTRLPCHYSPHGEKRIG